MPIHARGIGILFCVMELEGFKWRLINMIMIFIFLIFKKIFF